MQDVAVVSCEPREAWQRVGNDEPADSKSFAKGQFESASQDVLTRLTQTSQTSIVTIVFVCKLHPRTEDFYHWSLGCSPFFVFFGCHEFVTRFQQRFVTSEMYKSILDRADGHVGAT